MWIFRYREGLCVELAKILGANSDADGDVETAKFGGGRLWSHKSSCEPAQVSHTHSESELSATTSGLTTRTVLQTAQAQALQRPFHAE